MPIIDKDELMAIAPLACGAVGTVAALAAICIRPSEAQMIKDILTPFLVACGTAWQANRSQKVGA